MGVRFSVALVFLVALGSRVPAGLAFPPKPRDDEAKLLDHLEHEKKPVKRAKLEVRLGRLKLQQALVASDKGDFTLCRNLLDAYQARMKSAWATLAATGIQASRKSDGFKQLEIALRESRRALEDLETSLTYEQREDVEKVRTETVDLHNRVLGAIFPGGAPRKQSGSGTRKAASKETKKGT